jgi:hypothetical protein
MTHQGLLTADVIRTAVTNYLDAVSSGPSSTIAALYAEDATRSSATVGWALPTGSVVKGAPDLVPGFGWLTRSSLQVCRPHRVGV